MYVCKTVKPYLNAPWLLLLPLLLVQRFEDMFFFVSLPRFTVKPVYNDKTWLNPQWQWIGVWMYWFRIQKVVLNRIQNKWCTDSYQVANIFGFLKFKNFLKSSNANNNLFNIKQRNKKICSKLREK